MQHLTGYNLEEINQLGWYQSVYRQPDVQERAKQRMARMRNGEHLHGEVWCLTHKDGSARTVQIYTTTVAQDSVHGAHVMAVMRDITEQTRAEIEQERLQRQLQQAQKMEAIGQLTGGIAHDFNNILAAILGYTELAMSRCVSAQTGKLADYLQEIHTAGVRARDLIAKMLAFSRAHAGAVPQPLQPQMVVREVMQMLTPALPSSIHLVADLASTTVSVRLDSIDLHQILTNLIINARDAIEGHGTIEVRLRTVQRTQAVCSACHRTFDGEFVELSVRDDGHGMSDAILQRIFDPFFTTKAIGKGSGMGLSVVHGLVHQYQGHLQVSSKPAGGTLFQVLLPAVAVPIEAPTTAALPNAPTQTHSTSRPVFVVDDEVLIANFLGEWLESRGFQAQVFTDSHQAWAAFSKNPQNYAAAIVDQTMPGLSGDQLLRQILTVRADFPVVLCTGYSDHIDAARAAELGACAFFYKPIPMNDLYSVLLKALS